jgi:hypothetical protein
MKGPMSDFPHMTQRTSERRFNVRFEAQHTPADMEAPPSAHACPFPESTHREWLLRFGSPSAYRTRRKIGWSERKLTFSTNCVPRWLSAPRVEAPPVPSYACFAAPYPMRVRSWLVRSYGALIHRTRQFQRHRPTPHTAPVGSLDSVRNTAAHARRSTPARYYRTQQGTHLDHFLHSGGMQMTSRFHRPNGVRRVVLIRASKADGSAPQAGALVYVKRGPMTIMRTSRTLTRQGRGAIGYTGHRKTTSAF